MSNHPEDDRVVLSTEAFCAYVEALSHTIAEVGQLSPSSPREFLNHVMYWIETLATQEVIPSHELDSVRSCHVIVERAVERRST